jgi:hypothetical protein
MDRLGAFRVRTVLRNLRNEQENKIGGSHAAWFWSEWECCPPKPRAAATTAPNKDGLVEATPSRVFGTEWARYGSNWSPPGAEACWLVSAGVPEGRHNVAKRRSGGKSVMNARRNPVRGDIRYLTKRGLPHRQSRQRRRWRFFRDLKLTGLAASRIEPRIVTPHIRSFAQMLQGFIQNR